MQSESEVNVQEAMHMEMNEIPYLKRVKTSDAADMNSPIVTLLDNHITPVESKVEKPKKPLTAYFIFMRDMKKNKEVETIDMHKNLSNIWSSMGKDEKQKYVQMAEQERQRYTAEMEEYEKMLPTGVTSDNDKETDNARDQGYIPEHRVKSVLKSDPSLQVFKKETIKAFTQITLICEQKERFAIYLLDETVKVMKKSDRKKIKPLDLYAAVNENPALGFLKDANIIKLEDKDQKKMEEFNNSSDKKQKSAATPKEKKKKVITVPPKNHSMLDFFKAQ